MKKIILTESQVKVLIDNVIEEQVDIGFKRKPGMNRVISTKDSADWKIGRAHV